MLQKSPSGSLCPYYYMGGELHPLKYGSYFNDKTKLFEVIQAEEDFILKSTGTKNRRIWVDLYETDIDEEVIETLVSHIQAISNKIHKICLVGCETTTFKRIRTKMKKQKIDIHSQIKHFADPEKAKQWLIGKRII